MSYKASEDLWAYWVLTIFVLLMSKIMNIFCDFEGLELKFYKSSTLAKEQAYLNSKMATFQYGQLGNIAVDQIQLEATTAHRITELTTKLEA